MQLKRSLNKSLSTFSGLHFPYVRKKRTLLRYHVTVGIGGNIGDVGRRFEHLFFTLQREKRVNVLRTSLILKNPPFGFKTQDDFLNSVVVLQTDMQPVVFLDYLMRLEKKFGRTRSFPNAPRTLDLDIIFFDNRVIDLPKLQVPHPSWSKRESVVIPLAGLQR